MTINDIEIKPWVKARILDFLNRAKTIKDITNGSAILDNPETGHGYTIGATVAERILDKRNKMQFGRFKSIGDLAGIKGLGLDKVNDLIFSFGVPAPEAFRKELFDGILLENWELTDHTTQFEDATNFRQIVDNGSNFKDWVSQKMTQIRQEKHQQPQKAHLEGLLLRKSHLEIFDSAHYGAIALAFWFYQFDADNWFTFERMRQACEKYLSYYPTYDLRQETRLFKGFQKEGLHATSNTQGTLPVIVNYAEQAITIWEAVLND